MLRFESLGPTLIDCEGCANYISVYIEPESQDAKNNNIGEKGQKVKKMTIIDRYIPMAQKIKDMDVYDDDIWVMSFPKVSFSFFLRRKSLNDPSLPSAEQPGRRR